ncbi:tbc1 domain family member related [Plasmopara halstedii]|uniref:TBC1 domain family member 23 n=1 Tax=Plasmopara halstedii TaxID=4781 RepID=A0A0P1AH99_PLAHL|nr:tbc1 domain family member related [Plasmopara halstedii]CEG40007.1 tbc1 domain family member related [Plasmopara halstedii]|eukprot:XP_024576376.1 tbc1 domain family member related [Plasmopara halstedii]
MTLQQAAHDTSEASSGSTVINQTTHSVLTHQLELEMQKRRPDHFIIGVICRSIGGVPSNLRSQVWQELLGVARTERLNLDQSILQVEEDLDNQRVIAADAVRTRSNEPRFQASETVELVVKLLTYYCKCRNIRYKQGMNEVLAPFLLLTERKDGFNEETPLAEGVVFQCFYALIDRFLPHMFIDKEFQSLQCSLQLFRLLMLYHDPELCHYLDQHDMTPELYVTPWFMTLFARSLPPETVFYLWDFFLLEKDPYVPHFVAYALVKAHRKKIFQADIAMLPQVLSSLTFSSCEELEQICADALLISELTPKSFKRDLFFSCHGGYPDAITLFLDHLHASSSLQVYPEELVQSFMARLVFQHKKKLAVEQTSSGEDSQQDPLNLESLWSPSKDQEPLLSSYSDIDGKDGAKALKFILLDCRPALEYHKLHLSLSHHIDPDIMERPDALDRLMKGFARMKGCHFCFVGPSVDSASEKFSLSKTVVNPITLLSSLTSNDKSVQESSRKVNKIHGAAEIIGSVQSVPPFTSPSFGSAISASGPGILASETASHETSLLHVEHVSVTRIVLMFLQKGFKYVSRLDGGFEQLEKSIQSMDVFTKEQLLVSSSSLRPTAEFCMCSPNSVHSSPAGGFNLLARIGINRSRTPSQDDTATEDDVSSCSEFHNTSCRQSTNKFSPPSVLSAFHNSRCSKKEKDETLKPTSGAVSTLSQRLTLLKAAARDAVSSTSYHLSRANNDAPTGASKEGWIDLRMQTIDILEKSERNPVDVELQSGPIGISFQKSRTTYKYQAVVDSVVPDTQASACGLISTGDLLVAINGVSLEDTPFLTVIDRIIEASRPVTLRFLTPAKVRRKSNSLSKISPLAPTLVCATRHSLCITWDNTSLPVASRSVARYQIQYAKLSGDEFTSWLPVAMKQEGTTSEVTTTGSTDQTNGTMVGLEPGESIVFRMRCWDGQRWGPYSLSSSSMKTLKISSSSSASSTEPSISLSTKNVSTLVFLPGVCPEYVERGRYFYRVLLAFHARDRPDFYATKLSIILKKGAVITGSERLVCPGTNQVFVRLDLGDDDDIVHQDQKYEQNGELILLQNGHWEADIDTNGLWAFEYTPDGAVVLERLPECANDVIGPTFQNQAISLAQSFFQPNGIASSSPSGPSNLCGNRKSDRTSLMNSMAIFAAGESNANMAALSAHAPVAPHIGAVIATSSSEVVVTWDPVNDVSVTKYQIQYAKDRLAAMWWTVKPDISADTLKSSVSGLQANTLYLFRVRSGTEDNKWSPYSEPSEHCRTLPCKRLSTNSLSSDDNEKNETERSNLCSNDEQLLSTTLMSSACESAPMRTGSTILDKAVAVATRLKRHSHNPSMTMQADGAAQNNEDAMQICDGGNTEFASRFIDLSKWKSLSNKNLNFFSAIRFVEQDENAHGQLSQLGHRELVLTPSILLVLNLMAAKRKGFALVEARYDLTSLIKVVEKDDLDLSLVFYFKDQANVKFKSADNFQQSDRLIVAVDDAKACVQLVQEYHAKVKFEK